MTIKCIKTLFERLQRETVKKIEAGTLTNEEFGQMMKDLFYFISLVRPGKTIEKVKERILKYEDKINLELAEVKKATLVNFENDIYKVEGKENLTIVKISETTTAIFKKFEWGTYSMHFASIAEVKENLTLKATSISREKFLIEENSLTHLRRIKQKIAKEELKNIKVENIDINKIRKLQNENPATIRMMNRPNYL